MTQPLSYSSAPFPGIAALACSSDFPFRDHIHNGHVIWMNSEGGEHFTVQGASEILQPGEIGIIEPGVVHSNQPCSGSGRYLRSLYLEPAFWESLEKMLYGTVTGKSQLPTTLLKNEECWKLMFALHEGIIAGCDALVLEDTILTLFSEIRTSLPDQTSLLPVTATKTFPAILLDYMQENLSEQISLTDLAEVAGCTSYHVIRLFKSNIGMSPHAYLIQLRLEKARRLLDKKHTITDAALLAGFSDQSHLTRNFKNRYGLTPGRYIECMS